MPIPRKPSKSPANGSSAHRTNVLLEKLAAEFRTFGEGLSAVRERVERMEPKVNQLAEDVPLLKIAVRELHKDVKDIKGHLETSDQRLTALETKVPT